MQMRFRASAFRLLYCLTLFLRCGEAVNAKSETQLEGSVKEEAALCPYLKVLTEPATPSFTRQGSFAVPTRLFQYKGEAHYLDGKPAQVLNDMASSKDAKMRGIVVKTTSANLASISSPMWAAPGYKVIIRTAPTNSTASGPSRGNDNAHVWPVSLPASNKGVTSWKPGYEIRTVLSAVNASPVLPKPGVKSTGQTQIVPRSSLTARPLMMMATPLLLPELVPKEADKNLDWDAWYKRVAKAIYSRWQCSEVGPGAATVRVTVTRTGDVSGQLVEFVPADGVERNVAVEKRFREAAVYAVNSVRAFEIPNLPPLMGRKKITFDIEMRRKVDGPIGIDVALVHTPSAKNHGGSNR